MQLPPRGFFDADPGWISVGGPDHLIYVALLLLPDFFASWWDWAYLPGAALATLARFWIGYAVAALIGARTGTWVPSAATVARVTPGARRRAG